MKWAWAIPWVAVAACAAQSDPAPELLKLAHIKLAMVTTLERQPNYTCVQEVERSRRRLPRKRFELHDTLRLEVALVDGKEMFAWPGARKFEQTDLTQMIAGGAIGTGDFALHARAVFQSRAPVFDYRGGEEMRGRRADRFDFRVTQLNSGYHIRSGGHDAVVGYHGSLWADAVSHQLVRLEVNADDIPAELGIREARDVMDYDRMRIGESDFLLPSGSELTMTDLAGNESRNRTQFKGCRQYSGESILTFDTPPEGGTAASPDEARKKETFELPPDSTLEVRLLQGIDSTRAATGDAIDAVLEQRLRVKGRVLVEKGAKVSGRIVRLEREGEWTWLDLRFFEIEGNASRAAISARLDEFMLLTPGLQSRSAANARGLVPWRDGIRVRGPIKVFPGSHVRLRIVPEDPH